MLAAASNGSPILAALWFLLLGGLVAADARLSLLSMTALGALLGLVHGYFNGAGIPEQSSSPLIAVVGIVAAVFVLIALAAAFAIRLQTHWARIAVRVVGSWIAASGLLMLGWAVHVT
jgi:hydrogenase/urease accessory protein HupE